MAIWKSRVSTGVRAYFKVVSATGTLVTGLPAGAFTALVIDPADSANQALTVTESAQQAGVYYVDVPAAFLGTHGAGAYGLSLGVHSVLPSVNDEVLLSLEVTVRDLDDIPTAVQNRDAILSDGTPFPGALIDASVSSRADGADYTAARAALLDSLILLDVAVSSRADGADYTAARAALLDSLALLDASVSSRAAPGDAMALTPAEREAVADALLDRTDAVEVGATVRGALRVVLSALAGKTRDFQTNTPKFRNAVADSKDRIVATQDVNGNRTSVSVDMA